MTSVDAERELQGLLQFFYQCPVGLIEIDDSCRVLRINPAAVALLSPAVPGADLLDLSGPLHRLCPAAAAEVAAQPPRLGRLATDRRLLTEIRTGPSGSPMGLEIQLVRVGPDRVMVVVLDISTELWMTSQEHARTVDLQRAALGLSHDAGPTGPDGIGPDPDGTLEAAVGALAEFTDADVAAIVLPDELRPGLRAAAVAGPDGGALDLRTIGPRSLLHGVLHNGGLLRAEDGQITARTMGLPDGSYSTALALPLLGAGGPRGVALVARRTGRPSFGPLDVQRADLFAGEAALALELFAAAANRGQLVHLTERDQRARAVHDHAIQTLFATGLHLQRLAYQRRSTDTDRDFLTQITLIDDVISQLRSTLG